MEGFHIEVQAKPRFQSVGEFREAALSRVTPKDIENRIIKLKADVNVSLANIDKELGCSTKYYSPPPSVERRSRPTVEHSGHQGRILGIR